MKLDKIIAVRNSKTVYRDGDKCIKLFDSDYSKADILNEALNQARIEETGLNIPKIREIMTIDGKWAIVSDYIKGKTLSRLMTEDSEKDHKYIEYLVDLQMTVHSKKCPLLNKLTDKTHMKIDKSLLNSDTKSKLYSILERMPKHDKTCHGDFNPSNIIIDERNQPYIIDWAHVTCGNASADAAGTYLYFLLNEDFDGAEKYLNYFCKKSKTDILYIKNWIPVVAAAKSVKGNEKERKFLLSQVNILVH